MKMILHEFNMGDVEDPQIYAADPIYKWQQTEQGKWAMEHVINKLSWRAIFDTTSYSYRVIITGKLSQIDQSFYLLKWGIK
jgi:DNA-directed RNA polymerase subunit H (RpoH/RPB5)